MIPLPPSKNQRSLSPVATSPDNGTVIEVKALFEVGFEYVCKKDDLIFLRKPK